MSCNAGYEIGEGLISFVWCSGHPVVYEDGDARFCIFHAPQGQKRERIGGELLSVDEFNEHVFRKINQAKKIDKKCDLSGTIFEGDIAFREYDKENPLPPIDFQYAIFNEEAIFIYTKFSSDANFYSATFNGEAKFTLAEFNKFVNFSCTTFNKNVTFSSTNFNTRANYFDTQFFGDADFGLAKFNDSAYFFDTQFREYTSFNCVHFKISVTFKSVTFHRKTDFSMVEFYDTNFFLVKFYRKADFSKARFKSKANFYLAQFSEEAETSFSSLEIEEQIRFESMVLRKTSFLDTDLRKIYFQGCDFPQLGGRDALYDEIKLLENIKWNPPTEDTKKVGLLYRRMKQKYKDEHDEAQASIWHQGEKEMYRRESLFRTYFPLSFTNLYKFSSGYGEHPVKAFITLAMLIGLAAFSFAWGGLEFIDMTTKEVVCVTSKDFKFSNISIVKVYDLFIVTIKLLMHKKVLGYAPARWTEGFVLFFQIILPIQAALFAFALRNRFRR